MLTGFLGFLALFLILFLFCFGVAYAMFLGIKKDFSLQYDLSCLWVDYIDQESDFLAKIEKR
jgi:hypothetical protein